MVAMRLVHYSDQPLGQIRKIEQGDDMFKPRGLWVSDDDCKTNWYSWCMAEDFRLDHLTHVHDITLAVNANILILKTISDIDSFTDEWRRDSKDDDFFRFEMPWARICAQYQGLIITPYLWQRRLTREVGWYYSWDCASGCIWDPNAIASVTLREIINIPVQSSTGLL